MDARRLRAAGNALPLQQHNRVQQFSVVHAHGRAKSGNRTNCARHFRRAFPVPRLKPRRPLRRSRHAARAPQSPPRQRQSRPRRLQPPRRHHRKRVRRGVVCAV